MFKPDLHQYFGPLELDALPSKNHLIFLGSSTGTSRKVPISEIRSAVAMAAACPSHGLETGM